MKEGQYIYTLRDKEQKFIALFNEEPTMEDIQEFSGELSADEMWLTRKTLTQNFSIVRNKVRKDWRYLIRFSNCGDLVYNTITREFEGDDTKTIDMNALGRRLRTKFSSMVKLEEGFLNQFELGQWPYAKHFVDSIKEAYKNSKPYTYEEAFRLENQVFKALVFATISVPEMMNALEKQKIAVDGCPVKRELHSESGEFLGYKEYDSVFETYSAKGDKIGLPNTTLYAVRCWCTSTNEEHWIWIDEKYKDDPLAAIASTFQIHENVIPKISALKRQGDIMLIEMKEEVEPEGNVRPLTKDEYFDLLVAEA